MFSILKNYEGLLYQPNSANYIIQNIDRAEKAQGWPFKDISPNLCKKKFFFLHQIQMKMKECTFRNMTEIIF